MSKTQNGINQDVSKLPIEERRKQYEKDIELNPNDKEARNKLAILLEDHFQDYEGAKKHYEIAIKLDPNFARSYNNLAFLLKDHYHKYDEAKKFYEKAIELDPNDGDIYYNLAILLENYFQDYEETRKHYEIAIELNPNDKEARNKLAILLEDHFQDYEGAKKHYEIAIEIDPNYIDAHYNLAILLNNYFGHEEAKKHYEIAIECCNQALKIDSKDIATYCCKGMSLFHLHRDIEALQSLKKASKILKEGNTDRLDVEYVNACIKDFYAIKQKIKSPQSLEIKKELEVMQALFQKEMLIKKNENEIVTNPALKAYYDGFVFGLTQIYNTSCLIASGKFAIDTSSILSTSVESLLSLIPVVGDRVSQGVSVISTFVKENSAKQKAIKITQIANTISDFDQIAKSACLQIIEARKEQIQNITENDLKHNSIGQMLIKGLISSGCSNVSVESGGARYNSPAAKLAQYDVGKIGLQISKKNEIENPADTFALIIIEDYMAPLEVSHQDKNDGKHCCCLVFAMPEIRYDSPILQAIYTNPTLLKHIEDLSSALDLPLSEQNAFLDHLLNGHEVNTLGEI